MDRTLKKQRTYYSQEKKDSYVASYKRWNGSLNSFCRYHELSPTTFRQWITTAPETKELEFVELRPKSTTASLESLPQTQITITFPNGIQVQLPLGCDQATIVSVCSTLGGL